MPENHTYIGCDLTNQVFYAVDVKGGIDQFPQVGNNQFVRRVSENSLTHYLCDGHGLILPNGCSLQVVTINGIIEIANTGTHPISSSQPSQKANVVISQLPKSWDNKGLGEWLGSPRTVLTAYGYVYGTLFLDVRIDGKRVDPINIKRDKK